MSNAAKLPLSKSWLAFGINPSNFFELWMPHTTTALNMTERKSFHGPGSETQGGGFRGGPKRWTGRGPAPARHIPWPEVRSPASQRTLH